MILRKLQRHLAEQDWTAVVLDLLIVIVGVVIGFQVTEWNRERLAGQDYQVARAELVEETKANLAAIAEAIEPLEERYRAVGQAYDILAQCRNQPGDLEKVERGLLELRSTYTPEVRLQAMEHIVTTPELATQQTDAERVRLRTLHNRLLGYNRNGEIARQQVFDDIIDNHPMIEFGEKRTDIQTFDRLVRLNVPLSEACKDNELRKYIVTWERSMGISRLVAARVTTLLEKNLEALQ